MTPPPAAILGAIKAAAQFDAALNAASLALGLDDDELAAFKEAAVTMSAERGIPAVDAVRHLTIYCINRTFQEEDPHDLHDLPHRHVRPGVRVAVLVAAGVLVSAVFWHRRRR